jgi:hypothetical protein
MAPKQKGAKLKYLYHNRGMHTTAENTFAKTVRQGSHQAIGAAGGS